MTSNNKNYGKLNIPDWIWWVGVIESRADITQTGRYKVRIMGYHTGNKETLPTKDLPYATVINSPTNASTSGIMETPNLLPGSTVIGFFADGDEGQMPVIIGSLAGMPQPKNEELPSEDGFNDPTKTYPRGGFDEEAPKGFGGVGEPDLPRLARDEKAETHYSLLTKREERVTEIRTAKAPDMTGQIDPVEDKDYEGKQWEEPYARAKGPYKTFEMEEFTPKYWDALADMKSGGTGIPTEPGTYTSMYPFNQVRETESGFVQEIDNTPSNERYAFYHPIGNFEEVQADGTRINKIKGSDYEIIAEDKNVVIKGSCNVTIMGDSKILVQGDKYEEIEGDHYVTIHGSRHTAITGNDIRKVSTDVNDLIGGERSARVSLNDAQTIVGNQGITVTGSLKESVTKQVTEIYSAGHNTTVSRNRVQQVGGVLRNASGSNMLMLTGGEGHFKSKEKMELETSDTQLLKSTNQQTLEADNTDIKQDVDITGTSTATVDHLSNGKSGFGHTHTISGGSSAGTTSAPD